MLGEDPGEIELKPIPGGASPAEGRFGSPGMREREREIRLGAEDYADDRLRGAAGRRS